LPVGPEGASHKRVLTPFSHPPSGGPTGEIAVPARRDEALKRTPDAV